MADENDVDLSSFMEVVTSYKCKFCSFVCLQPKFMSNHVKTSHIQPKCSMVKSAVAVGTCDKMAEGSSKWSGRKPLEDNDTETNRGLQDVGIHGENTFSDGARVTRWEKCHTELQVCSGQDDDYVAQFCNNVLGSASKHKIEISSACTADSVKRDIQPVEKLVTEAATNSTVIICMTMPSQQDSVTASNVEKSLESGTHMFITDFHGSQQDSSIAHADASNKCDNSPVLLNTKKQDTYVHVGGKSELVADLTPSLAVDQQNSSVLVSSELGTHQVLADLTHIVSDASSACTSHGASATAFAPCPEYCSASNHSQIDSTHPSKTSVTCHEIPTAPVSIPDGTTHAESENESSEIYAVGSQRSEEDIIIKELFLCGLCSQTFCSIEAVGDHMKSEHSEVVGLLNKNTTAHSQKFNQGNETTTRKKKPGRKKKSEMIRMEQEKKDDSEDEDWQPGRDLGVRHDGRKRRKTRPPRALKKDYYIETEKKVSPSGKKRRNRYSIGDTHVIKCHIFGCQARFMYNQSLEYHMRCHDDLGLLKCPECGQEFRMWSVLKLHLWKDHHIDLDLFQCDECQYKVDTLRKLNIHKEIHSDNRPYTCDICGKGFKQFSQMKNHQVIHEGRDAKASSGWHGVKQCAVCERWYANRKSLQKHVEAVHRKERPFSCPYCDHTAARKAMIQLHIRTHTGEKPFMCNVCQYSTGDHNSMRKHRMRHTGQRQYRCKYCSYTCIQAVSLKSHLRTKHPGREGVYLCESCGFKTVNKVHYDNHLADHKNGLIQTPVIGVGDHKPKRARLVHQRAPVAGCERVVKQEPVQVEMQLQTMESGEAQISVEDLARLTNCTGLLSGEVTAVQLIYSALSAISQNSEANTRTQTAQLSGGVETTIQSESAGPGVTTHNITFRVPDRVISSSQAHSEPVVFDESLEVIEGSVDDQTTLHIDLDAITVTGAAREGNTVDSSVPGN